MIKKYKSQFYFKVNIAFFMPIKNIITYCFIISFKKSSVIFNAIIAVKISILFWVLLPVPVFAANLPKINGDVNCLTLDFVDLPIVDALRIYFDSTKQNFILDKKITGNIELHLNCVPSSAVLSSIVALSGVEVKQVSGVYYVMFKGSDTLSTSLPGVVVPTSTPVSVPVDKPKPLIPDVVKIIRLFNLLPADVLPLVAEPDLTIKEFDTTQLYLSGQQAVVDKVAAVITQIDKPKKQYMVKAKLISTSDVFMENLGVTFNAGIKSENSESSLSSGLTTAAAVATGGTALIIHKSANVLLSARVTAAVSDGDAIVISEPHTIAYDNKESSITQGLRIPYQTQLPQGGYSVSFVDAALSLKVTPRRGDDKDRIILDVYFSKNSAGAQSSAGVEIETREIKTTIALRSGETVLLGGIDESSKDSTDSGIPYLRDIPILGYAFGSTLDNTKHNKIVLMLTPTMIN